MATTVNLVHADLLGTVADLRRVLDDLTSQRRATDLQVDALLDGGWSGRGARSYLEGYERWGAGCDVVLEALSAMTELLLATRADLVVQDDAARAGLTRLSEAMRGPS